jgi:chromosome segregation ATPase
LIVPETAIAQAILDEIRRLATRFDRVEEGLSTLDGRMSILDSRMSDIDGRMSAFDGRMSTLDGRMSDIDGRMSALEGRMSALEGRMSALDGHVSDLDGRVSKLDGRMSNVEVHLSTLESRMANIEDVVADLDGRIKLWPDMHFLAAAAKAQLTHSRETKADLADIGVRVREIYQSMATDPEIKSLRDEVSRFRDRSLEHEVRLGSLEGHVGIESVVEPR